MKTLKVFNPSIGYQVWSINQLGAWRYLARYNVRTVWNKTSRDYRKRIRAERLVRNAK